MTSFEKDIVEAIRDGCCYSDRITERLMQRGRRKVDDSRLLNAMWRLRERGIIRTSMAGRTTLLEPEAQAHG